MYYYLRNQRNGRQVEVYLGKQDDPKVHKQAMAEFRYEKCRTLVEDIALLSRIMNKFKGTSDYEISQRLNKASRMVLNIPDPLERAREWAAEEYEKSQKPMRHPSRTKTGEMVRSKGECIWYDNLVDAGIPFRYEMSFTFVDPETGKEYTFHPDFTILCADGTLLLIEHYGMLDRPNYRDSKGWNLYMYQAHGYILGSNLFLTADKDKYTTDSEAICRLIEQVIRPRVMGWI